MLYQPFSGSAIDAGMWLTPSSRSLAFRLVVLTWRLGGTSVGWQGHHLDVPLLRTYWEIYESLLDTSANRLTAEKSAALRAKKAHASEVRATPAAHSPVSSCTVVVNRVMSILTVWEVPVYMSGVCVVAGAPLYGVRTKSRCIGWQPLTTVRTSRSVSPWTAPPSPCVTTSAFVP